ncbi:MAG: DUF1778 domain-containing protein [Candidatus Paceibacterota bacterium]|jgi:uncharacterized protein (DUF1778 family)
MNEKIYPKTERNNKKDDELTTQVHLSEAKWKAFNKALNRPARKNPKLKKLLKISHLFSE